MTVPIDVISTKRSAWRDPSTALGMTKGDVRDDKGDARDDNPPREQASPLVISSVVEKSYVMAWGQT